MIHGTMSLSNTKTNTRLTLELASITLIRDWIGKKYFCWQIQAQRALLYDELTQKNNKKT